MYTISVQIPICTLIDLSLSLSLSLPLSLPPYLFYHHTILPTHTSPLLPHPHFQCGTISEVRLIKTRSSSKRANAYTYIEFMSPDPVQSALALDRSDLDRRPLFVSRFREKGEKPQTTQVNVHVVYIANLLPSQCMLYSW